MFVPLRKARELTGLSGNTLRKYADEGYIPYYRLPNGDRMFDVRSFIGGREAVIVYARVSTAKQRDQLQNQLVYLLERYPNAESVADIGSGLNFKRKGLLSLLERALHGDKLTIVVAYRDRLARFGFDLIEWFIKRSGGKILVLHHIEASSVEELTRDLIAIITVFSARIHGLRDYKRSLRDQKNPPVSDGGATP
jgi:predicted site-specific integrase-resolvase